MTQDSYYNSPNPPSYGPETPKDSNRTLVIILAIVGVLLLCCCCVTIAVLGWMYGDAIVEALGLNSSLIPSVSRLF